MYGSPFLKSPAARDSVVSQRRKNTGKCHLSSIAGSPSIVHQFHGQRGSQREIIGIVVFHVLRYPQYHGATDISQVNFKMPKAVTYLSIIKAFATTLATPNQSVGNGYSGTMYFSTMTVCSILSQQFYSSCPGKPSSFKETNVPHSLQDRLP